MSQEWSWGWRVKADAGGRLTKAMLMVMDFHLLGCVFHPKRLYGEWRDGL